MTISQPRLRIGLSCEQPSPHFQEKHLTSAWLIGLSVYETSYVAGNELKKLFHERCCAYTMSLLSSTDNSRFTACGDSSASTSMTCFAIDACLADANGISTLLIVVLYQLMSSTLYKSTLHGMPIGVHGLSLV